MQRKGKIGKKYPHTFYVPPDLVEQGFVEEVNILTAAKTITIVQASATLEEVATSLELVLKDIYLRRGYAVEILTKPINSKEEVTQHD